MIITPTSLSISRLLGSEHEQYVIPTYQRRYSWHERQVWELIDDIRLIEEKDTHLLGSIVCLVGYFKAGLNQLELVDGQQRLTTISILLECLKQRLQQAEESGEAAELGRLLSAKPLGGKALPKIVLDSIDASEFERLIQGNPGETVNQNLATAFQIIREWIQEQPLEALARFLYRLKNQAIIIRLDVGDAKDAFKLFETINNRGLQLSPTDIIKNLLLGNAARFGEDELKLARECWASLIRHLDGIPNPDAFFRYFLMVHVRTRVTNSQVIAEFKKLFMTQVREAACLPERHLYADVEELEDDESSETESDDEAEKVETAGDDDKVSFKEFLQKLVQFARIFGELLLVRTNSSAINRHLRNLKMIKAVQTYGFLMHLRVGGCTDKTFLEVLKLTEGFILRRHVCRERANETESLFARLCRVDPGTPLDETRAQYRSLCPPDARFREDFASTQYPPNLIDRARFVLEQIELSRHGSYDELQVLGSEAVHIEHIIPQKIKTKRAISEFGDWPSYLGENTEGLHDRYVSRIGNLTLFAGPLNIGASNNPFIKKKQAYEKSGIQLTRALLGLDAFNFKSVEDRSTELADTAVGLWPVP